MATISRRPLITRLTAWSNQPQRCMFASPSDSFHAPSSSRYHTRGAELTTTSRSRSLPRLTFLISRGVWIRRSSFRHVQNVPSISPTHTVPPSPPTQQRPSFVSTSMAHVRPAWFTLPTSVHGLLCGMASVRRRSHLEARASRTASCTRRQSMPCGITWS